MDAAQPIRVTHAAALALEYGDRLVVDTIRDIHRATARRVFRRTRLVAGTVESVHDTVFTAMYDGLSLLTRTSGSALRTLAARGVGAPVESGPTGRRLMATVNGLIGAELDERDDPHAIVMSLRKEASDVVLDRDALERAYPDARGNVVLLLHGLVESDESWNRQRDRVGSTYVDRLLRETAATPLVLRYNTGLHVSDNGTHLSDLIERLCEQWPVQVTRISLVGHSMGGLVARAATNHAVAAGLTWPGLVRHVVCLGTPHLGASLEKVAHLGARALQILPEAAPFGRILDVRSPGIVDLRHGYISRDEWHDRDLTRTWGLDRIAAAPLLHADYHFVAATLGPTTNHPLSLVLGDLLVRYPSAVGRGRRDDPVVAHADVRHVGAIDHFALLNNPQVGDWLVRWISDRPRAAITTGGHR